jgi:hypothetical protein
LEGHHDVNKGRKQEKCRQPDLAHLVNKASLPHLAVDNIV